MRKLNFFLLSVLILINSCLVAGCWNYREIDEMAIVAGVAIDKGKEKAYEVTVEVVKVSGGLEGNIEPQTFSTEGDTLFEAARNMIAIIGKRLYWSHAKIIIISKEIAEEGVIGILDWFMRDSETRIDVNILISKEKTAKEILNSEEPTIEDIISFMLDEMSDNEKSLFNAPHTEMWAFINNITAEGISTTAPTVSLKEVDHKKIPSIKGTAVFKGDRLIGFLDELETKALLFVKDEVKGGILVQNAQGQEGTIPLSLEIFNSKTKIKPIINEDEIEMQIQIDLHLAIGEIQGGENFMEEELTKKLKKDLSEQLKSQIENLVQKAKSELNVDIFGFGSKLNGDSPEVWKKISKDWIAHFKELKVTVNPKIDIKNSGLMAEPLKMGD